MYVIIIYIDEVLYRCLMTFFYPLLLLLLLWCSRTSFFGGAVSTRDSITLGIKKPWYAKEHQPVNLSDGHGRLGRGPQDIETPVTSGGTIHKKNKKKSIVPLSYPGQYGQWVSATGCEKTKATGDENLCQSRHRDMPDSHTMEKKPLQRTTKARQRRRPLTEQNSQVAVSHAEEVRKKSEKERVEGMSKRRLVKRRGTFYGEAMPPSALQPVPQRPSYSDESDIESLIDDGDIDVEDVGWVGELMHTLGSYATKDFSKIDAQRDFKMQASFDQIMDEEHQTAKIGIDVDRREAQRARKKKRRYHTSTNREQRHLILCSSSSSDDEQA